MFFIPLNQTESVELVIHALRAAAGQADCSHCPTRKVCMQQCLTIAASIEQMVSSGTLPQLDAPDLEPEPDPAPPAPSSGSSQGRKLRVVK